MNSRSAIVLSALFFVLQIIVPAALFAGEGEDAKSSGSGDAQHGKVLVIPYDPAMYFSDSDEMLAESNGKSEKEIRNLLRYGLNSRVKAQIVGKHGVRTMLDDTSRQAYRDLQRIYQAVNYEKAEAMTPKSVKVGEGTGEKGKEYRQQILEKLKQQEEEEGEERKSQSDQYKEEEVKGRYYMNVNIPSTEMLEYFRDNYGTELFLFLNQFELITNYNHCLDRATNTFERTIKVHYSLLNAKGEQLAGDVAIVKFPSSSNDLYEIIRKNFPIVGEYLSEDLPAYGKANAETGKKEGE